MIRLNEKDKALLKTGKVINLSDPAYAYMGGEFGSNNNDYLEALIYDTSNNFLESAIVSEDDYYRRSADHESTPNMIVIRTGSVLRKMGYDRGTFVVKYNFLRNIAGSYETVLVDKNNVIWPGNYHRYKNGLKSGLDPEDAGVSEERLDLFLKDFKHYIHEISPSRQEIRIAPQAIKNDKYLRDFYQAHRTKKEVVGMGTGESSLVFKDNDKANSTTLQGVNFSQDMVGGSFVIPKAFISSYTPLPTSRPPSDYDVIEEREGQEMRARFYFDRENSFIESGDSVNRSVFFDKAMEVFANNGEGYDEGDSYESIPAALKPGYTGAGGSTLLKNTIGYSNESSIERIRMVYVTGVLNTVVLKSNSILPNLEIPTNYTWEILGLDNDTSSGNNPGYNPIFPREGGSTDDGSNGGDFILAGPDPSDPTVATPRGISNAYQSVTTNSTDGSTFIFQLASKDVHIGIKLTVSQALGDGTNASSTIYVPNIIYQNE